MTTSDTSLVSGRRLARSTVWNLVGMAAPMVIGVIAIPLLIAGLGKERFGLLSIIWMGVGYFSLFDMGLGRALTRLVAEQLGRDDAQEMGPLVWSALLLIFGLGVAGAGLVGGTARLLVLHVINVEPGLQPEAVRAFIVLAVGMPAVILTSALIGVLEAHQRFAAIAAIRIPLGVLTFLGPLAALQFTPSLVWATTTLLAARALSLIACFLTAAHTRPELYHPCRPQLVHFRRLFQFGSWLTITNIIGPLLSYFDRFLIGAMMSLTAVTYYVTPYEVLTRLQILPRAMMGVLFPALTILIATDQARTTRLYGQASRLLLLMMLPVACGLFLFAPEALQLWLGTEFRLAAAPVARWLAFGVLINTMARPPITVLQSADRPDLVAKTHLAELLPYALLLWLLTRQFGIAGTAAAWTVRVVVDMVILNEFTRRKFAAVRATAAQAHLIVAGLAVGFLLLAMARPWPLRAAILAVVSAGCLVLIRPLLAVWRRSPVPGGALPDEAAPADGVSGDWPADGLEAVPQCPVCRSDERRLLHADLTDRFFRCAPGRWQMQQCTRCHSAYLDPRPTPATIGLAYANYFTHDDKPSYANKSAMGKLQRILANGYRNQRYGTDNHPSHPAGALVARLLPKRRAMIDATMRHLPVPRPGQRLLDLGCGNSDFLLRAQTAGWDVVGVDFDEQAVAAARRRGFDARLGQAGDWNLAGEKFDAITVAHVIEHVHDPMALLQDCYELLQPGGFLWLDTPNIEAEGHRLFGAGWRGLEPPRHLVIFSLSALEQALAAVGFSLVERQPYRPLCASIFAASLAGGADGDLSGVKAAERLAQAQPERREFITLKAWKP